MNQSELDSLYQRILGAQPKVKRPTSNVENPIRLTFDAHCQILGIENPTQADYDKWSSSPYSIPPP